MNKKKYYKIPVTWRRTGDVDFPYESMVEGTLWRLRLNDFPAEPLYTLFIDSEEIGHLDDWPPYWTKS